MNEFKEPIENGLI